MKRDLSAHGITLFATCPASNHAEAASYARQVREISRWSEEAGCEGILIYTDYSMADPWLVAQLVIASTERLSPLVAVQPAYMHPYSAAKMIASLAFLHGRKVYLNLVAGGFTNDLAALNEHLGHDDRYNRLREYATVVQRLVQSSEAISFEGRYYNVNNLKLTPAVPPALQPGYLISGSSPAGLAAARALDAIAVEYPKPANEYTPRSSAEPASGIRLGIIARRAAKDAWTVAHERFPVDRRGQLTHQFAMKVSDSSWHKQLSELGETLSAEGAAASPYWLVPFENYHTFCPYLVGTHERVAEEVARYLAIGYRTFILDVPASPDEMRHIGEVFERAALCEAA